MPSVTCPTCGERGKIAPTLIGARIKCKKCGNSFMVSPPPAAKAPVATPPGVPPRAETPEGIEVEGLDASSWSLSTETGVALKAVATVDPDPGAEPSSAFVSAGTSSAEPREYKIITSKDKVFDGKFDLTRLEEVLNQYGRQGWSVKAMSIPHVKGFSGVLEETVVVVLER